MARSIWKPIVVNSDIINSVLFYEKSNLSIDKLPLNRKRIISSFYTLRNTLVINEFVGLPILVHNGKGFNKIIINKSMVGFKLGSFLFTKRLGTYIHSKLLEKKKPNTRFFKMKGIMRIPGNGEMPKFHTIKKKKVKKK